MGNPHDDEAQALAADYHARYGRNISQDMADLDSAELLAKVVDDMRGKPEQEWVKGFADLGQKTRLDGWKQMAALNSLAGPQETLVHELSLKGKRVDISARDEGKMENAAQAQIGRLLSP